MSNSPPASFFLRKSSLRPSAAESSSSAAVLLLADELSEREACRRACILSAFYAARPAAFTHCVRKSCVRKSWRRVSSQGRVWRQGRGVSCRLDENYLRNRAACGGDLDIRRVELRKGASTFPTNRPVDAVPWLQAISPNGCVYNNYLALPLGRALASPVPRV
eukprot:scaffold71236_cov69-Phaeocystis_antarctica.AAC.4